MSLQYSHLIVTPRGHNGRPLNGTESTLYLVEFDLAKYGSETSASSVGIVDQEKTVYLMKDALGKEPAITDGGLSESIFYVTLEWQNAHVLHLPSGEPVATVRGAKAWRLSP